MKARKRRAGQCLLFAAAISLGLSSVRAASFKVLYSFPTNSDPSSTLVQGRDGVFYGTTFSGGAEGYGSIYRVTAEGGFTNLFSFSYTNGAYPSSPLVFGADGNLYGTARAGGPAGWYGTVFRMSTEGALVTLAAFAGPNGANPLALTQGRDGFLYGATVSGGAHANRNPYGDGTVFRVTTNGLLTSLASFDGTNGWAAYASPVQARDGALYGTTTYGGAFPGPDTTNGGGTVFKVTTNGVLTTLFCFAGTNGAYPQAPLIEGRDGMLYGVASSGGPNSGGTVFRITTAGEMTTVASFGGASGTAALYPEGGLIEGTDGAFYGTTTQGYVSADRYGGSIFRVTTNGLLSRIYSFGEGDGRWPDAALTQAGEGVFYGTCVYGGGPQNGGTVFRIDLATRMVPPERAADGMKVTLEGLPGTTYTMLRAGSLSGPWSALSTVIPGTNGVATWVDGSPPSDRAFYRAAIP